MPESLLEVCVVASVLLVSFALAWLSRRPPPARGRRSSAKKLILTLLALLSFLIPPAVALFFLMPGGSLEAALSLLVGSLAIATYLLPTFLRLLRGSTSTLWRTLKNLYVRPARLDATRSVAHHIARRMLKRNVVRALHRHAWATVALVLTAISISLTHRISSVHGEGESSSSLKIAVDSPQPLLQPAVIRLIGTSGEPLSAAIDLLLKPGQSIQFAFSALAPSGCLNMNLYSMETAQISYGTNGPAAFRLVTVQATARPNAHTSDEAIPIALHCTLDITPFAETFAERTFRVESMNDSYFEYSNGTKPAVDGHIVDFRIEGASDITLLDDSASPVPLTDTERWLPDSDSHIVVKWHDTRSSEERDVLLVFIGGLLGLAASGLLEWIRPYIAPE